MVVARLWISHWGPGGHILRSRYRDGWLEGFEPSTARSTIWCSAMLSYSHHGAGQEPAALKRITILPGPVVREWRADGNSSRDRPDDQVRGADRVPERDDARLPQGAQALPDRLRRHRAHL